MPKLKTRKGMADRVRVTRNGKLLRRVEAALHKRELASVAAVAEKFRSVVGEAQPFIHEIAVISPTSTEEAK